MLQDFGWNGLAVELKLPGTRLFKRDNKTPKSDHIKEQLAWAARLNAMGYKAVFAFGFDECVEIISSYLTTKPPDSQG